MNFIATFKKYAAFIPFTFTETVLRFLDKNARSILDVGCGFGHPIDAINKRTKFSALGIDSFLPAIRVCKNRSTHDAYVLCDVRFLPIRRRSFDVILCFEVIEHLSKCDGFKLVEEFDRIVRQQVIISTPVGFLNLIRGHKENPSDIHRSGWIPAEFETMGYKVRGINGLRFISGARYGGIGSRFAGNHCMSKVKKYLVYALNHLSRPLAYFVPNSAFCMLCTKKVNHNDPRFNR